MAGGWSVLRRMGQDEGLPSQILYPLISVWVSLFLRPTGSCSPLPEVLILSLMTALFLLPSPVFTCESLPTLRWKSHFERLQLLLGFVFLSLSLC